MNPSGEFSSVLRFAENELQRYLQQITGQAGACSLRLEVATDDSNWSLPPVKDVELDDAYQIQVEGGRGFILGSNSRSVLLGVYRFLYEIGCRWVRPGNGGEIVPQLSVADIFSRRVHVCEMAAHRHRGVCIEGATSREHVLEMIAWLPKVGLNSYFIQFREAYAFYERWYRHIGNPTLPEEPFDQTMARELTAEASSFAKSRGLLYHAVGHGWTCEAVGVPSLSWIPAEHPITTENRELLAEIKGKRDFFNGISLNTNLCYGNPEARRKVVAEIVRYAASHPQVDYLHFWLADDVNNQCECLLCAETRPADFYVMMLNDLDRDLTARGLSTRIVMLCYLDLLWPPERERIGNPKRFALMFAPITRSFSQPFPIRAKAPVPLIPPYQRNALVMPLDVEENLAFLQAWRELSPDFDTFDFDYHLMWAHFFDPGHHHISDVLHADIERLQAHGLNGFMSCQVQRLFLPTGLPMMVLGRSLWNPHLTLEVIANDQLGAEFGPDWKTARDILRELTRRFDPSRLGAPAGPVAEDTLKLLDSVPPFIDECQIAIRRNQNLKEPVQTTSWQHLEKYLEICSDLARALAAKARGDTSEAHRFWRLTLDKARAAEIQIAGGFDLFHFAVTFSHQQFDHVEDPILTPSSDSERTPKT